MTGGEGVGSTATGNGPSSSGGSGSGRGLLGKSIASAPMPKAAVRPATVHRPVDHDLEAFSGTAATSAERPHPIVGHVPAWARQSSCRRVLHDAHAVAPTAGP